jgi:Phosphotransferase enzyme family
VLCAQGWELVSAVPLPRRARRSRKADVLLVNGRRSRSVAYRCRPWLRMVSARIGRRCRCRGAWADLCCSSSRPKPWRVWSLGTAMGQMHARLHQTPIDADRVHALPRIEIGSWRRSILHMDFHPLNVMTNGHFVTGLLDWANIAIGDPRVDLAYRHGASSRTDSARQSDIAAAPVACVARDRVAHWLQARAPERSLSRYDSVLCLGRGVDGWSTTSLPSWAGLVFGFGPRTSRVFTVGPLRGARANRPNDVPGPVRRLDECQLAR